MIASMRALAFGLLLFASSGVRGRNFRRDVQKFLDSLHYRTGSVDVKGGHSTLKLTDDFRYLEARDAQRVLQAWGNPPDESVLGMILPANLSPLDKQSWAVVDHVLRRRPRLRRRCREDGLREIAQGHAGTNARQQ